MTNKLSQLHFEAVFQLNAINFYSGKVKENPNDNYYAEKKREAENTYAEILIAIIRKPLEQTFGAVTPIGDITIHENGHATVKA